MKKHNYFFIFIFLYFLSPSLILSGQMYKWIDKDGVAHFSDSPPEASLSGKTNIQKLDSYERPYSNTNTDNDNSTIDANLKNQTDKYLKFGKYAASENDKIEEDSVNLQNQSSRNITTHSTHSSNHLNYPNQQDKSLEIQTEYLKQKEQNLQMQNAYKKQIEQGQLNTQKQYQEQLQKQKEQYLKMENENQRKIDQIILEHDKQINEKLQKAQIERQEAEKKEKIKQQQELHQQTREAIKKERETKLDLYNKGKYVPKGVYDFNTDPEPLKHNRSRMR
jgi:hypothetical protein